MKGFSFSLILLLSVASASGLDFSPQYAESVQDGFPVRRLYFTDKDQRIYLALPKDWRAGGNGQRATLTPPNLAQASVILENSSLKAQVLFDEKGLDYYRKAAVALVPSGATDVRVAFEKVNSLPINGWTSFEMAFSYQFYGQSVGKSVLFLNLAPDKQIQLRVETRQEDFEKVYGQARGVLSSWFAPPPQLEAALEHLNARH